MPAPSLLAIETSRVAVNALGIPGGTLHWFVANKDMISIALAVLAIALSFATAISNRRARREQAFLGIHELLIRPELQQGRKLLLEHWDHGDFPGDTSEEWKLINHAMAAYNTLAMYVAYRIVPKRWVLEHWHHPLRTSRLAADAFMEERARRYGRRPFPYLDRLMEDAARYRSRLSCCQTTRTAGSRVILESQEQSTPPTAAG